VQFSTDGKNEAWISLGEMGRTNWPRMIKPENGKTYTFKLVENKPF
jgi:hypothetical protein